MKFFDQFLQKPENAAYRAKLTEIPHEKRLCILYKNWLMNFNLWWNQNLPKPKPFKFTDQQRKIYTTVGGTPFLDGNYTVFW